MMDNSSKPMLRVRVVRSPNGGSGVVLGEVLGVLVLADAYDGLWGVKVSREDENYTRMMNIQHSTTDIPKNPSHLRTF
jgi:hypothetical protein